jgi:hypothetical protein
VSYPRTLIACLSFVAAASARADDFDLHGYLDLRGVDAPAELSWSRGGLGKTRFGGGDTLMRFGGGTAVATTQLSPSTLATAAVQLQSNAEPTVSLLEAWFRYRPVSLNRWRWSMKAGAFFPPLSLENTSVGWTSPWTLTPSAINSWVGEELRVIGGEAALEWRGDAQIIDASVATYFANDPTGTLLDDRGWSLSDLSSGVGTRLREPDVLAREFGAATPYRYNPFQELDGRPGWYGHLGWRSPEFGQITLLRYDNEADPTASTVENGSRIFAWRTRFWALGAKTETGPLSWIAQAMTGSTDVLPPGTLDFKTDFQSAFLLVGWNTGAWRPTLRWDYFWTRGTPYGVGPTPGEHGLALTAAMNWEARSWLRLTAEVLRVESARQPRSEYGLDPKAIDTQVQISARLLY